MRTNDKGFLAMVDAVVFIGILLAALAVTAAVHDPSGERELDAKSFLDAVEGVEVRLSDFDGGEDDSLVKLTDMLAYSMATGERGPVEYLVTMADMFFGPGLYSISLAFGDLEEHIGKEGDPMESARTEVPVQSGGSISIEAGRFAR